MASDTKPKIGIVSGTGPLAGSDVFAKLLEQAAKLYGAVEDSEYPEVILLNHGIAGVDNTATLVDNFKIEIIEMVHQLEAQGATVIGIACNTAHLYLDDISVSPETTLVNLIDAVAKTAAENSDAYLLLTSHATKDQKLYHGYLDKYGVKFAETSQKQQELLDEAIGFVMAHKLDEAGKLLEQVLSEAKHKGLTKVIAGCTEIPIAINHAKALTGLEIIDSNVKLAKELLKHYYAAM